MPVFTFENEADRKWIKINIILSQLKSSFFSTFHCYPKLIIFIEINLNLSFFRFNCRRTGWWPWTFQEVMWSNLWQRLVKSWKENSGLYRCLFHDLNMTLFRKNKSKSELHQEYQCTVRFLDDSEPIQVAFTVSFASEAWQLFSPVKMFCFFKVCSDLRKTEKLAISAF